MIKNKRIIILLITLVTSSCSLIDPITSASTYISSDISNSHSIPSSPDGPSIPSIAVISGNGMGGDEVIVSNNVASGFYIPGIEDTLEVISIESLTMYGDCTLFKYGNFEMLIDTNQYHEVDFNNVTSNLSKYINDGKLDILITSHPHSDHVGAFTTSGLDAFLSASKINEIGIFIDSGAISNNFWEEPKQDLINFASYHYIPYNMYNGDEPYIFLIGPDMYLEILNTRQYVVEGTKVSDPNNVSIASVLHYGKYKYLFCGDLNYDGEAALDDYYPTYFSDDDYVIMKANHHCSDNGSNNTWFVDWAKPDKVLVSAALIEKNRIKNDKTPTIATYKGGSESIARQHPHIGALNNFVRYANIGLDDLYWNAINGTLHFKHSSQFVDPIITGEGRSYDYVYYSDYKSGELATASYEEEINTPFYRSHCAKTWKNTNGLIIPREVL